MKNILLFLCILVTNTVFSQIAQTQERYWNHEGDPEFVYYELVDTITNQVLEKGTFRYKKRDGEWIRYYPDGVIQTRVFFVDGKKFGTWKFYDETGKLIMVKKYKNDELLIAEQYRYY
jgi:antitoxin component YwqK of YwqJK toxin-antitoxin module